MSCVDDQSREAGLRRRARALGSSTRFRCEPGVICVADRATGAREKHRAAPKALAIGLDAGGNRVSGLRAFDHDHTHVSLPWIWILLLFEARNRPVRLRPLSVRLLGGIAHLPVV
jgi:hypothetical protein